MLSAGKFSDSWCHNCGFQNSDFCPEAWILPSTINIVSFFFPLQCQAYFFWEIISQSLDKHTLLIPKWQWLANAVGLTYTSFTNASLEVTILVHFHQQCLVQALRRCILERWIYYMDRFYRGFSRVSPWNVTLMIAKECRVVLIFIHAGCSPIAQIPHYWWLGRMGEIKWFTMSFFSISTHFHFRVHWGDLPQALHDSEKSQAVDQFSPLEFPVLSFCDR